MAARGESRLATYRFGNLEIDRENFRVLKGGETRTLAPRAFDLLVYLVEHRGRVVEKQELFEQIWKEAYVTDNALTRAIKDVRRAIGDEADAPRYIETVPKRGYRFIAEPDSESNNETDNEAVNETLSALPLASPLAIPQRIEAFSEALPSQPHGGRIGGLSISIAAMALIVIVAAAIYFWKTEAPDTNATVTVRRTEQITTWSGLDLYPAISPDGNEVAYVSDQSGSFEIYVRQLAVGARELQLTEDGQQNFHPAWSPDGRWIAYYSQGRGGIWVVPARGGVARQLTTFGSHPKWSPDGRQLVFQSDGITDIAASAHAAMPPSTIWLVSAEGGEPRQLTRPGEPQGGHGAPVWSPDGKRVAFSVSDIWLSGVWAVDVESGRTWALLNNQTHFGYDPVYAPDGKKIFFAGMSRSILSGLWMQPLSPETGEPIGDPVEIASTGPLRVRHLTISADGKNLLYTGMQTASSILSIAISPDTGEPTGEPQPLIQNTSFRNMSPVFSPDGRRLAFYSLRPGSLSEIWVVDVDGKNAYQVTNGGGSGPSWFPDSREIAYVSAKDQGAAIHAINPETGRQRALIKCTPLMSNPRLSPDGRQFALNLSKDGAVNLALVGVEGGEPRQLTFDRELIGFASWSPDGRWIAAEMKRGEDVHLVAVSVEDGAVEQLTFDRGQSWPGGWSPDGDKLVFAGSRNGVWNVWWVSRSTKQQKALTSYTRRNTYVRLPAWSPRGDRIAYEYTETTGNIWRIELNQSGEPR